MHTIDCGALADGVDADWIDLRWNEDSEGGVARLCVVVRNEPGALAEMAGVFGGAQANIVNLRLTAREGDFHTFEVSVEVIDLHHVMRILSSLRANEAIAQAERL